MNHDDLLIGIAACGAAVHLPEPWRSRVLEAAERLIAERALTDELQARRATRPRGNVTRINPKGAA